MSENNLRVNKNKFLILSGVLFLLISLGMGIVLVDQQQNVKEKAYPLCSAGAEQCPMVGYPNHLLSCHPGEADGSPSDSLCDTVGRWETCGPNYTKWCCPSVGGAWTTNLTMCPSANATPSPPPPPPPTSPPAPTPMAPVSLLPASDISCPASDPLSVTFTWTTVTNASHYFLNIDELSNGWADCSNPNPGDYCLTIAPTTSYSVNLAANKSYRWVVAALNSNNVQGPISEIKYFSIGGLCTPWDINQDGIVNIVDIGIIIDYYNLSPVFNRKADVNSDGVIDIIDIGIVIDHYTF